MDATETCSSSSSSFSSSATHVDDSEDLPLDQLGESQMKNESLTAELQALQTKSAVTEENLVLLNAAIEQVSRERDDQVSELQRRIDEELKDKQGIGIELEGCRERIRELLEEKSEIIRVFSEHLVTVKSVKECLVRVVESMEDDQVKVESVVDEGEQVRGETDLEEELRAILVELKAVSKLASMTEMKLSEYEEMRNKEKRELENSVVSLTEENRDINSLLRIALVEKEAVEKSLNKLKGNNNEQKRVAILQIAERGLQKVGFGFMMGTGTNEPAASEIASANNAAGSKSDGSECEEEVVSLVITLLLILLYIPKFSYMTQTITQDEKNLMSFEEDVVLACHPSLVAAIGRSDTERLQSLTEKQAQKIAENAMYIKELEDRETMLSQNVEELLMEIKETEEEVARWREACELEVEAGKNVVEERDKVMEVSIREWVHVVVEEVRRAVPSMLKKRMLSGVLWGILGEALPRALSSPKLRSLKSSMYRPSPKSSFGSSNGVDMMEMWWSKSLSVGLCKRMLILILSKCEISTYITWQLYEDVGKEQSMERTTHQF
ncbi:hypothetical protein TEA_029079 [Camellia sinensis var. sinensis]|uniref:Uncharacterized protein n=1 Tax=Camellia sinensis var. sinensis TaxID=542762 RepID=A0A4S4DWI6_CAMSN|nr:hypothetical protein TEA_029079 [Camellia sinensis var. sinensis]